MILSTTKNAEPQPLTFILIDIVGAIHPSLDPPMRNPPDRRRSTVADTRRSMAETVTQKAVLQEAAGRGGRGEGYHKSSWVDGFWYMLCS